MGLSLRSVRLASRATPSPQRALSRGGLGPRPPARAQAMRAWVPAPQRLPACGGGSGSCASASAQLPSRGPPARGGEGAAWGVSCGAPDGGPPCCGSGPCPGPGLSAPVQPPQQWGGWGGFHTRAAPCPSLPTPGPRAPHCPHQGRAPLRPVTTVPRQQAGGPSSGRSLGLCERTGSSNRGPSFACGPGWGWGGLASTPLACPQPGLSRSRGLRQARADPSLGPGS